LPGNYPPGDNLEKFIDRFVRLNYAKDRKAWPWEIAEFYRHFKILSEPTEAPRLAVYIGAYNLIKRDAQKKGQTPTWIWVFDAIPPLFNLYRYAGAAVLRDKVIEDDPKWISPGLNSINTLGNISKSITYRGENISRNIPVLIPKGCGDEIKFNIKDIPFMDGMVDINRLEQAIIRSPVLLSHINYEGLTLTDKKLIRAMLASIGYRTFEDTHPYHLLSNFINEVSKRMTHTEKLDFNNVGNAELIGKRRQIIEKMYAYDL